MKSAAEPLPDPGTVHVWDIDLDSIEPAILSEDEAERAARIRIDLPRARFSAARTALRSILGRYTGAAPAALVFDYNRFGKPRLASGGSLRFNLSHSGNRALVAVANGREVGIDVERVDRNVDYAAIARRFFPAEEASRAVDVEQFFRVWTRREAYLKALGCGFGGLEQAMQPGWTVIDLEAGALWAAAVAARGDRFNIEWRAYK